MWHPTYVHRNSHHHYPYTPPETRPSLKEKQITQSTTHTPIPIQPWTSCYPNAYKTRQRRQINNQFRIPQQCSIRVFPTRQIYHPLQHYSSHKEPGIIRYRCGKTFRVAPSSRHTAETPLIFKVINSWYTPTESARESTHNSAWKNAGNLAGNATSSG